MRTAAVSAHRTSQAANASMEATKFTHAKPVPDELPAASPQVMAEVMGAEAALVRCQLVSGTHAISTALFACLRPGDRLLAVAGRCAEQPLRPETSNVLSLSRLLCAGGLGRMVAIALEPAHGLPLCEMMCSFARREPELLFCRQSF